QLRTITFSLLPGTHRSTYFAEVPPAPSFYSLSLHDALPIYLRIHKRVHLHPDRTGPSGLHVGDLALDVIQDTISDAVRARPRGRSEEHTSELQSRENLVCRLLLEKKKPSQDGSDRYGRQPAD